MGSSIQLHIQPCSDEWDVVTDVAAKGPISKSSCERNWIVRWEEKRMMIYGTRICNTHYTISGCRCSHSGPNLGPTTERYEKEKNQLKWKANRRCSMLLNLKCTRGITCETQERRRKNKSELRCMPMPVVLCKLARIARPMRARKRVFVC